jgi:hypothetical protein
MKRDLYFSTMLQNTVLRITGHAICKVGWYYAEIDF